jgi:hypothetical protein
MSGLFLLSKVQNGADRAARPAGAWRTAGRCATCGERDRACDSAMAHRGRTPRVGMARTRRSTTASSAGAGWACSTASFRLWWLKDRHLSGS